MCLPSRGPAQPSCHLEIVEPESRVYNFAEQLTRQLPPALGTSREAAQPRSSPLHVVPEGMQQPGTAHFSCVAKAVGASCSVCSADQLEAVRCEPR
eukprot:9804962-Alexandrium_andersonii.AAC.1